ncbi:MAG: LytTR family transcriptional regulator [Eubacterium sp.]|nr:LytTR family transcriptional regulator [Eubacterium sp.]
MKIEINVDDKFEETCISISCKRLTPELEKLLAMMRILEKQLVAVKDGETFLLDVSEVIYIEAVDRKTFVYTKDGVYESGLRLYELEQQLEECGFCRVSKSCLVRLKAIRSLKSDINRRIRVTLDNGEMIIASRQYADGIKQKLGIT